MYQTIFYPIFRRQQNRKEDRDEDVNNLGKGGKFKIRKSTNVTTNE